MIENIKEDIKMKKEINTTMVYDNLFDYLFEQAVEQEEKDLTKQDLSDII